VLESGGPISKRYAAGVLWPESNAARARDCLYKTLSWFRTKPELCRLFGLSTVRESISIRAEAVSIDLAEFDRCYAGRGDVRCCERAVELYSGPLLWNDCYDWTDEKQSRYEILYSEILSALAAHRRGAPAQGGGRPEPVKGPK